MKNIFSLENKAAVVFGGAGYIGSQVVVDMLGMGARVVVADIDAQALENPGFKHENCVTFECDVRKPADVRAAYDLCKERFGFFNAMANLVFYGDMASLEVSTDDQLAYSLEGVAGQVFRTVREIIPYFEKDGGVIALTSSMYGISTPDYRIYGTSGQNNPPAYGMGKAAVVSLSNYAAAHLAPKGIRCNCVVPGPIPAPKNNPPADFLGELARKTMLGRVGKPEDLSGAFIYLLSDASSFTTAESIVVDGGWTRW